MKRTRLSGAQYRKSRRRRENAAQKDAAAGSSTRRLSQGPSHSHAPDVQSAATTTVYSSESDASDAGSGSVKSSVVEDEQRMSKSSSQTASDYENVLESEAPRQPDPVESSDILIFSDIAHVKHPVADELRVELICRGSGPLQNKDGPFEVVKGRSMTSNWFSQNLPNQKTIPRSWLLYSPKEKSCLLLLLCAVPKRWSAIWLVW